MSVCLKRFDDPPPGQFDGVELWAPDYDKLRFWLTDDVDARIDLSVEQAKQLRDYLTELLPR